MFWEIVKYLKTNFKTIIIIIFPFKTMTEFNHYWLRKLCKNVEINLKIILRKYNLKKMSKS